MAQTRVPPCRTLALSQLHVGMRKGTAQPRLLLKCAPEPRPPWYGSALRPACHCSTWCACWAREGREADGAGRRFAVAQARAAPFPCGGKPGSPGTAGAAMEAACAVLCLYAVRPIPARAWGAYQVSRSSKARSDLPDSQKRRPSFSFRRADKPPRAGRPSSSALRPGAGRHERRSRRHGGGARHRARAFGSAAARADRLRRFGLAGHQCSPRRCCRHKSSSHGLQAHSAGHRRAL